MQYIGISMTCSVCIACRGSVGFVQLARDTITGSTVAIKFVEREHPSLAAGLLLREIGNQVCTDGSEDALQTDDQLSS